MEKKIIESDVLIIGGGTAGCYAAIRLSESSPLSIAVVEKAAVKRSGCLAAGVNALNAYITEGHQPMDYVKYAAGDADGIVREDLLLDISEKLNEVTHDMERRGLTILKDKDGKYVSRGWRNLKINGENIKPILEKELRKQKNVKVFEHINITDLNYDGKVCGAYGFGINDGSFYEFRSKAVLMATGGAAGLYRPNNPEGAAHQMWYSPFNTGAGLCMGILTGAEMTTFEMRFIALRCKDTIAPTGTLAQGAGAKQINALGEIYEDRYGLSTSQRLWGTVKENLEGRGPCYLKTTGIDEEKENELYKAYLNMAPMQTLKWAATEGPSLKDVEIEGTEPYVTGGHTASGFWIERNRMTTVKGLFAAGDVAGGAPQKYVTGAFAEGLIAAEGIKEYIDSEKDSSVDERKLTERAEKIRKEYEKALGRKESSGKNKALYSVRELERTMQKIMDEYAGGIKTDYKYTGHGLEIADERIKRVAGLIEYVQVNDMHDLLRLYELRDRLVVSRVLIAHLRAREETRWHCFQENADHPDKSEEFECYINSVMKDGKITITKRNLVKV